MSLVEVSLALRIDHQRFGESVVDVEIPGVEFSMAGEGVWNVALPPDVAARVASALSAATAAFVGEVSA